jgi:carbonic anhydrase/acetyltransferase-like protein (isoleucine patch superfamily)
MRFLPNKARISPVPVYSFKDKNPHIAPDAYIAPSAQIIGDVAIGKECYIGHGAILRADYGTIVIGDATAVEEGCIIHARPNDITQIGREVTLGHGAMVHNAVIEDCAVIGMRSVISDFSRVGFWTIIGEMGLVKNGQIVPPEKVAVGIPVKIVGDISEKQKKFWRKGKELYRSLALQYPDELKEAGSPP